MKNCPKCKLVNPDAAERCDCGYDFPSGTMQSSYLTAKDRLLREGGKVSIGFIAFVLAWRFTGLFGGLIVLVIAAAIYGYRRIVANRGRT